MTEAAIEVQRRDQLGKGGSKRLRKQDLIPAVLYGADRDPVPIQIPRRTLLALFKEGGHENRIFQLLLAGTDQSRHAMIRELQLDPVTDQVSHIDFQRIAMDKKLRVNVQIRLEGTPYGVKTEAGILDFVTREIEIECLPTQIPQDIRLDVSELRIGQHLEASSLVLPDGVAYVGEPGAVIASVKHARVEEVAAEATAEPTAEAEATEPEVLQRGKKEEAEES